MNLSAVLVFVVLCLTTFYFFYRRKYGYWKERGIPYEKPTVLIGNLGFIMRASMHDYMLKLTKKYKSQDYFGIFLGQEPALVINSKELAKQVLSKDWNSFQNRFGYTGDKDDILGALNLFNVKNPIWSEMRQDMAPLFTTLRLKYVTELMNENSAELVRRVQIDYVDNEKTVDLRKLFLMYASDTIGSTVFGLRVSALRDLTSPLWFITRHMVEFTFWRGFELITIFLAPALAKIMGSKFFSAPATDNLRKLFKEVVEKRKNIRQPNDKDLLNHFMQLNENFKLPDKQPDGETILADDLILAQAAIFIIGAIETSASALTFCVHELAHHPEEQDKLHQEISNALKEKGKTVLDYSDLVELTYLTGCIKETLRKYPALATLARICNNSCKLTEDVTIEKGTAVLVNVYAIHFNEEYYPEPEQWRPERFLKTHDNDNHNFTFLSFGEGPRVCIGKRYGYMQIRTALAQLVTNFRFEPVDPYVLKLDPYSITVNPLGNTKVKFVPR